LPTVKSFASLELFYPSEILGEFRGEAYPDLREFEGAQPPLSTTSPSPW